MIDNNSYLFIFKSYALIYFLNEPEMMRKMRYSFS